MIEKHIYVAFDGREFANQDSCKVYEAGLSDVKEAMSVISKFCALHAYCTECPMYIGSPNRCYFRDKRPDMWLKIKGE